MKEASYMVDKDGKIIPKSEQELGVDGDLNMYNKGELIYAYEGSLVDVDFALALTHGQLSLDLINKLRCLDDIEDVHKEIDAYLARRTKLNNVQKTLVIKSILKKK